MKILVISNLYPSNSDPSYGTFVKNFVELLQESNKIQKIDLCVIKGRTTNILKKCLKYTYFYCSIVYKLLFYNYDIVYTHIITHASIPLRLVSLIKPLKMVFNIHGEDVLVKTKLSNHLLNIAIPLLHNARMVVVPSCYFKKVVKEVIPTLPDELIYVYPSGGVADHFFRDNFKRKQNTVPRIGYVSRIDRGKGWDIYIDSLIHLINKEIDIEGIIVGTGGQVEIMLDYLSSKQTDKIKYLGVIPYDKLPDFYSSLDLFVFPTTLDESLGLVGLEAMACHVPVVGSEHAGLTDYLVDNYNGFFFNRGDHISLSDNILRYIKADIQIKNKLSDQAYCTAKRFSATQVTKQLIIQLEKITNESHK